MTFAQRLPTPPDVIIMNVISMVTTTLNEVVRPIHPSRMPVILDPNNYDTWLTGTPDGAAGLLKPFPAERMHVVMEVGKVDQ